MPHITIKHWPRTFTDAEKEDLVRSVTEAVTRVFDVDAGSVSIAVESVEQQHWMERVGTPEIAGRPELLWKKPEYSLTLPDEGA